MKCDVCGLRPASGVISMISNGKSTTRRICAQCMARLRRPSAYTIQMTLLGTLPQQEDAQRQCPACGRSERQLRLTGRVGCPVCYQTFAPLLETVIGQLGSGRRQSMDGAAAEVSRQEENRLDALREEMFRAVNAENYERAAELRDEIRALQAEQRGTEA